jgi:Integrase core domain
MPPRPRGCPNAAPMNGLATVNKRDAEIERLRRDRLTGARIARRLGRPRSTVGAVLRRLGLGRLAALDPPAPVVGYERQRPGELIHLDTKKLGRIDGVGHRITGCHAGVHRKRGIGWEALHVAIDDASRLAYTEILPDETKASAIAFLDRALVWFARHGVTAERIMTDNSLPRRRPGAQLIAAPTSATASPRPASDISAPGPTPPKPTARACPREGGGRALHPDILARMGPRLPILRQARPRHDPLDHRLQPQPTSSRPRRHPTRRKAEQRSWLQHLARSSIPGSDAVEPSLASLQSDEGEAQ